MKTYQKNTKESKGLSFLYHTALGRVILKILVQPWVSKIAGKFMKSKVSKFYIRRFLKKNEIDMMRFTHPVSYYRTFNDFFLRELKNYPKRGFDNEFLAPCDGKLLWYPFNEKNIFTIKHADYSMNDLVGETIDTKEWEVLVFRLTPDDYHHYAYIDDGMITNHKVIPGKLHTVQPIALEELDVFVRNAREVTWLNTKNFGEVIQVEVGALFVGKIVNEQTEGVFYKMHEKGYFEFGGSTIVYFIEKGKLAFDAQIIENSKKGIETEVRIGECLAKKK